MRIGGMIKAEVFIGLLVHIVIDELYKSEVLSHVHQSHDGAIFKHLRGQWRRVVAEQAGETLLLRAEVFLEDAFDFALHPFFLALWCFPGNIYTVKTTS